MRELGTGMILPLVAIVLIVLAVVAPGLLASLHDRRRRGRRGSSPIDPRWWPQFEREFREYVSRLDRDPGRSDASQHSD